MPKLITRLFMVCLILSVGSSLKAIDVPLKFKKIGDETQTLYSSGFRIMGGDHKAQFIGWKLPEFTDDNPLFGVAKFGDTELFMVFDRRKPDDPHYNTIYWDKNGNRDLTDDKAISGKLVDDGDERLITIGFPAFDIDIEIDGEKFPYSFKVSVFTVARARPRHMVRIQTNCYYTGEFRHNGKRYHVALGDQTYNGRFDDIYEKMEVRGVQDGRIIGRGDTFNISDSAAFDYYDTLGLGKWLVLGEELFAVSVDIKAGKMTLTPPSGELASLRLSARPVRLALFQKETEDFIMLYHPSEEVSLNPGFYCIYSYEMLKKAKSGDLWRLNALGSSACPFVEATQAGGLMRLGEPFTPKIEVQERSGSRRSMLTFATEGQGGEQIQELLRIEGTSTDIEMSDKAQYAQRPKEPTYEITKLTGEAAAQGSFEYG